MVPGVAGRVVGRGGPTARWQFLLPVWLAFEVDTVTSRALCCVYLLPQRNLPEIMSVGTLRRASTRQIK